VGSTPRTVPEPPIPVKIVVVDHDHSAACGVRDLGGRMARRLDATRILTNDPAPLIGLDVDLLICNYHVAPIMPWLVPSLPSLPGIKAAILHDYTPATVAAKAAVRLAEGFDRVLVLDPDIQPADPRVIVASRFLPERVEPQPLPDDEIRVGSFGFAMGHKGFGDVAAECVNLAEAAGRPVVYRLHAPAAHFVKAADVAAGCRSILDGTAVRFEYTADHRPEGEVVDWMAGNHVNCLLYDPLVAWSGLSGALDYALAARRPILGSQSAMFRHGGQAVAQWPGHTLGDVLARETYWCDRVTERADFFDAAAGVLTL
jgi:hypothetical protein